MQYKISLEIEIEELYPLKLRPTHFFAGGLGLEVNLLALILFPSSLIEIQIFSVKE